MNVLVCNVGSTSLKFKLFDMPNDTVLAEGKVERVGSTDAILHYTNRITDFAVRLDGQSVLSYAEGIRWYLVGDGRAKERLEKLTEEYGVQDDVVFVGRVSEAEANRYVHFADCAYLSFTNNKLFTKPWHITTFIDRI